MNENAATVSVLMPVYNCKRYLDEALRSIREQTFEDWELIAVNDGSTDRSGAILHRHAKQDPRIVPIEQENAGIVAALNRGLAAAQGDLIARMDGDDISDPQRLARQVGYLNDHPDCVAVGTHATRICPLGVPLSAERPPVDHETIDHHLMRGAGGAIIHPTLMARRSAMEQVGGYRSKFRWIEDLDLFLRLGEVGRLANLAEPHLWYRQHPGSTNFNKHRKQAELARQVIRDACERRGCTAPPQVSYHIGGPKESHIMWGWNAVYRGYRRAAMRQVLGGLRYGVDWGEDPRLLRHAALPRWVNETLHRVRKRGGRVRAGQTAREPS